MSKDYTQEAKIFENEQREACKQFWNEAEQTRKEFLGQFPVEKIKEMTLDDYVVGKQSHNSFCYWLDYRLKNYGELKGQAGSQKFGVYYSKGLYQHVNKFGNDTKSAFESVKQEIINLLTAGKRKDYQRIEKNKLASTVKAKILAVYYPEKYLTILNPKHTEYYLSLLDIEYSNELTAQEKNLALLRYKNRNAVMKKWDNLMFVSFLYEMKKMQEQYPEETVENVINTAVDKTAGYKEAYKLVKERKINIEIIKDLKELYQGRCQLCGEKDFFEQYGTDIAEAHHIEYFSKSQNNNADNIIIVCPNHHRLIHKLNPKFDRNTLSYKYKNGIVEKIKYDKHLKK